MKAQLKNGLIEGRLGAVAGNRQREAPGIELFILRLMDNPKTARFYEDHSDAKVSAKELVTSYDNACLGTNMLRDAIRPEMPADLMLTTNQVAFLAHRCLTTILQRDGNIGRSVSLMAELSFGLYLPAFSADEIAPLSASITAANPAKESDKEYTQRFAYEAEKARRAFDAVVHTTAVQVLISSLSARATAIEKSSAKTDIKTYFKQGPRP